MSRIGRFFSLERPGSLGCFLAGDTRESFLARIRIRKLLQYSRLASLILLITGPIAILFYEQPAGRSLGFFLLAFGAVSLLLLPLVARWKKLQERSEWVSPLLTTFFLIPCAVAVFFGPDQDRGRAFVFLGAAISTYCLSRRSFLVNYVLVVIAWQCTWLLTGLTFEPDDAVYCFLVVPVVGYMICASQTDTLVSILDLHTLAHEQQRILKRTLHDLTDEIERRRQEERLRQEGQELLQLQQEQLIHTGRLSVMGDLMVEIAHEIRQPLQALSMYAGVLQSATAAEHPDLKKLSRYADRVAGITQHTSEIIQRLQAFYRRGERRNELVCPLDIVRGALSLIDSRLRRLNVHVEFDGDGKRVCMPVLGDTVQLQQVVLNLLRNSCDALATIERGQRRIEIHIEQQDGKVVLRFRDNGCGLSDVGASRIFEPFYSTKPDGLGMGMAISRRIVEDHDGTLEYVPDVSPGTEFVMTLPAVDQETQTDA